MAHNRNKLLDLCIGNLANAVLHMILERAINDALLSQRYVKESATSLALAIAYRQKINPIASSLPEKDIVYIKRKLHQKIVRELHLRIAKGYQGIDLSLVDPFIDEKLQALKILT